MEVYHLFNAAAQAQVQAGALFDAVVHQHAAVLEKLTSKSEALKAGWNALNVLDHLLDSFYCAGQLNIHHADLALERLNVDLQWGVHGVRTNKI